MCRQKASQIMVLLLICGCLVCSIQIYGGFNTSVDAVVNTIATTLTWQDWAIIIGESITIGIGHGLAKRRRISKNVARLLTVVPFGLLSSLTPTTLPLWMSWGSMAIGSALVYAVGSWIIRATEYTKADPIASVTAYPVTASILIGGLVVVGLNWHLDNQFSMAVIVAVVVGVGPWGILRDAIDDFMDD